MIHIADILKARILVVDDDPDAVETVVMSLNSWGYEDVHGCSEPAAVGPLHREHDYDLILLDMHMPGMDGFQVMETLKEFERDGYLPVLAITADPAHKLPALQMGAKDFLRKPVDLDELQIRVRNMLEVRLLYRELEAATLHDG